MVVNELKECLACGSAKLVPLLDLGMQPPANSYKDKPEDVQQSFPLAVNRCTECFHVQLTHVVNPDILYKNYLYVSGTSTTMKEHFEWFAKYAAETFWTYSNGPAGTVLDIGCNDGSQLDAFKNVYKKPQTFITYGVDPAENLYPISAKKHNVYCGYFNKQYVENNQSKIEGSMDIIVAQNVFAHNPNPLEFLRLARKCLYRDGLLFIQTSQADMILNNEFDTIYHEHISFYNIKSMNELCKRADMNLVDVVKCPLHGNSYIFVIAKSPEIERPLHIENLISMEAKAGLYSEETYKKYAEKCLAVTKELKETIQGYSRSEVGALVVGYGAAAKGMTLLNFSGIKLDYIIDDNPLKQGKFTPGSNIPIVSSEKLRDFSDGAVFVPLAWNFFDEIKVKIKKARPNMKYDKFVTYFPEVKVYNE